QGFEEAFQAGLAAIAEGDGAAAGRAFAKAKASRPAEAEAVLSTAHAQAMQAAVNAAKAADWKQAASYLKFADVAKPDDADVAALARWLKTASKPVFADDFASGKLTRWEPKSGKWTVERGRAQCASGPDAMLYLKTTPFQDFVFECDLGVAGVNAGFLFGVVFRRTDRRWLYAFLSDQFDKLETGGGTGPAYYHIHGPKAKDVTYRGTPCTVETGKTYRLTVRCVGKDFACYVDGRLLMEGTDEKPIRGRLALCSVDANAQFDNVRVYRAVPLPKLQFTPPAP
ncbi:DUF1080 domain-containing protein, partial [bacterium]|nr:DUF1080 domain-containing protein [bacterium]